MKTFHWLVAVLSGVSFFTVAGDLLAQPEGEPPPLPESTTGGPDDLPPPPPNPSQPGQPGAQQPGYPPPGAAQPGYPPPPGYGQGQPTYPPPPGYGYGQPGYYGYGPPPPPPNAPPPPPQKGIYRHDGFYLRMGIGIGNLDVAVESEEFDDSVDIDGGGVVLDLGAGGTPVDGFVIGGRILTMIATEPTLEASNGQSESDGSMRLSVLQLFTEVYPWPDEGLHVLAGIGAASIGYDHQSNPDSDDVTMSGIAYSLGAGWEGWVGKEWSIGGMLTLNWLNLQDDDVEFVQPDPQVESDLYLGEAKASAFVPAITFQATFH